MSEMSADGSDAVDCLSGEKSHSLAALQQHLRVCDECRDLLALYWCLAFDPGTAAATSPFSDPPASGNTAALFPFPHELLRFPPAFVAADSLETAPPPPLALLLQTAARLRGEG